MSALSQIETDVARLPPQDQRTILAWLQRRLAEAPTAGSTVPEALKLFRELQREVGLSPDEALAWKSAVSEVRR